MDTKMSSNWMFMLHALSQPISSTCFNTVIEDILQLWHCRYGHLSFQGLKTLQQRKMVNGLPQFQPPSKLCKDCLVGKQHRSSIPKKSNWRAAEILLLVHADICGPINPISNSKKSPTFAVQNKTPEEAWGKLKPSVDYFRVFGCISHVHVPDSKRTKLDDKSFSCVLLGVSEESKAYRLYDPISQKIIINRDVVFEEDKNWDWDKKYEEVIVCDLEWEEDTEENNATTTAVESDAAVTASDLLIQNRDTPSNSNVARNRRPLVWTSDYEIGEGLSKEEHEVQLAMFAAADPIYFEEAVKSEKWRTTMDVEMEAIKKNGTWELTDLPKGGKTIGVKWVYKTKFNENREVEKHKARLVVKGYTQRFGIDYTELDVKSAFLHGELNEEVFVKQPCGYVQKGNEQKVYKLKKALYGLKQAPMLGKVLIVSLYVDDLIFTGNDELMFAEFKHSLKHEFDMTDLHKMRYFLGLEVLQKSDGIFISKKKYALEVDKTYYKQVVGSLMYLTATRPDLMFVVSIISRKGGDDELVAYTDSDYAGDLEDQKSTLGSMVKKGVGKARSKSKQVMCYPM
ncbi:Retrovirus-related Pol polyprotein from transposon TNT 1-94 [Vitis vinifera]|uniref:Retrovirus-related Pol polyprotein from transposon TNT 1-94 n=1 Tax=Vitis vinifera TaxID=29760 RepID=A0A438DJJ8_VITVI|nr:Retrovirus-related Pol polyprotein from transposon TNT 1-94 [Vitis vinifera]